MVEGQAGMGGSYALAALVVDVGDYHFGTFAGEAGGDAFTVSGAASWLKLGMAQEFELKLRLRLRLSAVTYLLRLLPCPADEFQWEWGLWPCWESGREVEFMIDMSADDYLLFSERQLCGFSVPGCREIYVTPFVE